MIRIHARRVRTEIFAGMVTALALIPETVSFSILAGVGPEVGLVTSVIFLLTISVLGGRPAMVSAAAGSIALVVAPLVAEHGVEYLIIAVIMGGFLQICFAWSGVIKLMRYIPASVLTGFVNALAILIFTTQIPHLIGVPWLVYPMAAVGLAIMVFLPRLITTAIPAPLVATVGLTIVTVIFAIGVPRVGDEGEFSSSLPSLTFPAAPLGWHTLWIVLPYAVGLALVGLLETLITQRIVDGYTQTETSALVESQGQGVANIVTGLFGGMGGCAMIGQTMMNVKGCGGRTRLSTVTAALTLLCLLMLFTPTLTAIPMAALVAVMFAVSFTTMDWKSIAPRTLRAAPASDSVAMLTTVAITVPTHNLAYGVVGGVVCALILRKVAQCRHRAAEKSAASTVS